jgi:selenocysteine lyase/cysteine desulfurase
VSCNIKYFGPHAGILYGKRELLEKLAAENIYVWNGNYYAINVSERLGVEEKGGMVRVGPVHYNTVDEINRLGEVLKKIAK